MKQQKRIIGQTVEDFGQTIWRDYAVLCPICQNFSPNYGEASETDPDGDIHHICDDCAARLAEDEREANATVHHLPGYVPHPDEMD